MSTFPDSRVVALILAAGAGRRMGSPKPLLPWGETTLLGHVLGQVARSRASAALVVTGCHAPAVEREAGQHGAACAHNPDWSRAGMSASLQAGLRAAEGLAEPSAVLVLLVDQPGITPELIDAVIERHRAGGAGLVATVWRGRRGHPVLFGRPFFAAIHALPPDGRPAALLERHADALHLVEAPSDAVLRDLDTPEDYGRARLSAG